MSCCDQTWGDGDCGQNQGNNLDRLLNQILGELNNCKKTIFEFESFKWKTDQRIKDTKEELTKKIEKEINNVKDDFEDKLKDAITKTKKELKECCKKEKEEIKEILTNKVDQEKLDQVKQELEKKQKELAEKNDKEIDELKKELEAQIKAIEDSDKSIIGEYKWMPIGSVMPQGWVKVALSDGFTLVQGSQIGITSGANKKITFYAVENPLAGSESYATGDQRRFAYGGGTAKAPWIGPGKAMLTNAEQVQFDKFNHEPLTFAQSVETFTTEANNPNNLAAGVFAELWQYVGVNN